MHSGELVRLDCTPSCSALHAEFPERFFSSVRIMQKCGYTWPAQALRTVTQRRLQLINGLFVATEALTGSGQRQIIYLHVNL